jgi:hypothetical protein
MRNVEIKLEIGTLFTKPYGDGFEPRTLEWTNELIPSAIPLAFDSILKQFFQISVF